MDKDIISVKANDRQEDVANLVKKYDINMVPVTNEENKLIGIITVDDIIDVLEKKTVKTLKKCQRLIRLRMNTLTSLLLKWLGSGSFG